MYHVVAATTNPAKIKTIQLAFEDTFGENRCRIESVDVASGVSLQPIGNAETRTGARQRGRCGQKATFGSEWKPVSKKI